MRTPPISVHPLARTILATLVALVLTAVLAAVAGARTVFVIEGRGWGHGVGMSQYGAYGLALQGATYEQILATYYRGTYLAPAPPKAVRVLLNPAEPEARVSSTALFTVSDGTGKQIDLPPGVATVSPDFVVSAGGTVVDLTPPLRFEGGAAPIEFGRPYRGSLVLTPNLLQSGKPIRVVNQVSLEEYLYGVVPREMPSWWPLEALKAQAVAARSYALTTQRGQGYFDVYADVRSQVYGGILNETPQASAAVDATAGQVLMFNGQVASTFYFSTSGGRTAANEDVWTGQPIPYLRSVEDPTDSESPYHRWQPVFLSSRELGSRLGAPAPSAPRDATAVRNASGRVELLVVGRGVKEAPFSPEEVRDRLGLCESSWRCPADFNVGVLSLAALKETALFGEDLHVTGLARGIESPVLERRINGGWEQVEAVEVDEDGRFSVTLHPSESMMLRLNAPVLRASGRRLPAAFLRVVPRITLKVHPRGRVFRGRVEPKSVGASVRLERLGRKGWRALDTTTVRESGAFIIKRAKRRPGQYRVVVSIDVRFGTGVSSPVTVPR